MSATVAEAAGAIPAGGETAGGGTAGSAPAATPARDERGWLRRLAAACWRYRAQMLLAFGASLLGMAFQALVPLVQRTIVDDSILAHTRALAPLAEALVAMALISYGTTYVRRYVGGSLALRVQHDLRNDIFQSLSRLDGARQDELQTGQIIGRATSDITMVQGLLSMLPVMTGNLLLFLLSLVAMTILSPLLTVIALAVGPGLMWISVRARKRLFPATWDSQQQAAAVAAVVDDAVTGVRVVKGFGQEEQELDKLDRVAKRLFGSRVRAAKLTAIYNPALRAIPALGQVGVLALGGYLAVEGRISLGTFLAFSTYLAQLIGPVRMLSNLLTIGQQARASVIRVFEVIDSRPLITEAPGAVAMDAHTTPDVHLDHVTFGYVPSRPILDGFDLRVAPGETVALVGTSGSGKSTVSMLLPRFYDVTGGAVRVGGHDVRDLTIDSVRASIGLVMEDSFLFSESVRANIAYGRPDATDAQVVAAAKAAQAHEFITGLAQGYDTVIGEQGLTLSGGQRQRVALARALITDPRLLILDDATSAVDAQVEAEIHAILREVMADRTTILIAHRRSTLELADRVAVLDGGRVVDVGTSAELQRRCPLFRLLLSGPGDDAEGIDAGEPEAAEASGVQVDGVTLALWDEARAPATARLAGAGVPLSATAQSRTGGRGGLGAARRGVGGGAMDIMASMPATPELLAAVDALPPANDVPDVDEKAARAADGDFTLKRLIRPLTRPLLLAFSLVALDAMATLAVPVLIRTGVDDGVTEHTLRVIWLVSWIAFAVVIADAFVNWGQTRLTARTGERFLYTLRVKTFAHLQRLGLDYYEREMSGRIMTRMTTDVDAFSTFLQTGLTTTAVSLLTFAGILIALLLLNWTLGLVVLAMLPFMIAATLIFRAKSARAYTEAREKVSIVNADLQENVAGMRVAQAYRREQHNQRRFSARSDAYRASRLRAQRYIATYFPFVQFLSDIAAVAVLVVGASLIDNDALTAGALIAYLLYIDMFFAPVQQLSQVFDGYQQAMVGLARIRDLLRTPTSTPAAPAPVAVGEGARLRGQIEFKDVRFRYGPQAGEALRGVALSIAPGETVALVGQTGAGKSTLVKLVSRFYDVTSGSVEIDGVDVRAYDIASYRHRTGLVPQEAYLFPGTVRDTIAYGRPSAANPEVEAAARAVGAHEMISRLDGGYYHEITERGRNMSAGQRQLLALARAQLVDPDILIMDEATAALDLASESAVIRASDALAGRRTTLVVAHRLTTAARADRIVVLDGGQVVEDGTHEELLARGGLYATQWEIFSGGLAPAVD